MKYKVRKLEDGYYVQGIGVSIGPIHDQIMAIYIEEGLNTAYKEGFQDARIEEREILDGE